MSPGVYFIRAQTGSAAGTQKLVHTPHFGWLTDADAKAVRDAGVDVLSCAGFGVPVTLVVPGNASRERLDRNRSATHNGPDLRWS